VSNSPGFDPAREDLVQQTLLPVAGGDVEDATC
jgi:hypothetical protein